MSVLSSSPLLSQLDLLSEIEHELSQAQDSSVDPLALYENIENTSVVSPVLEITPSSHTVLDISIDPLSVLSLSSGKDFVTIKKSSPSLSPILGHIKFFLYYIAVSTAVFAILLVSTNWSAYWTLFSNFVSPNSLKASSVEISNTLSQSKILVHASDVAEHTESQEKTASEIKKQLVAENIQIQEDPFSMKSLIPRSPNRDVSIAITPYDNRLIIPKIGKNIPLVDVGTLTSFDFDHMENIFMQELEKWVVRYPGTALPGEDGNAFIFGHSSNYPWIKGEYNEIFALLDHLEYGDEIIVYYGQKKYTYVIREKKVVRPGDVKALEREGGKKELSLMTCWPIGTTLKRLLVFSELKE